MKNYPSSSVYTQEQWYDASIMCSCMCLQMLYALFMKTGLMHSHACTLYAGHVHVHVHVASWV